MRSPSNLDIGRVAELLAGPGLGLAAFLSGFAVLHGSTFINRGRAISVVGPAGAGKSTLAAAVVQAGGTFCSDGMTIVDLSTGECGAGPPHWKLHDDSVASLQLSAQNLTRVSADSRKWLVKAPHPSGGILSAVLVLDVGDPVQIGWFSPAERVLHLMKHAYAVEALLGNHTKTLFERMSALARRVRVGQLTRPVSLQRVREVADWIANYDF